MNGAKKILDELNCMDEHQKIEAKQGFGKSVLESICAFSNEPGMDGGTLLIGVHKEDNGNTYSVVGVEDCDKVACDIATQCRTNFNVPIRPNIKTEEIYGKKLIMIEVSEAEVSDKPVYIKTRGLPQGAYRRIGSTDQKCTDDDMASLFHQRGTQTYDETVVQGATFADIDLETVEYYRALRSRVNPVAEELTWSDEELLLSLSAIVPDGDGNKPTLAGILLFGKRKSLRRLFPMMRVDYIRVQGKEWIENPDTRFVNSDMRGSLLQLVRRVQDQIFEDLPKAFALAEGDIQASSHSLPVRVLREAIVNALMHASYRAHQPIQIRRYDNRIEIHNPGYSLKNEEQLGEPGSRQRNPKIAAVFHETNLAETKGSGIRVMRKLMEENGFAPPTFESNRDHDTFTARLLLHHFLTVADISWLSQFQITQLNDAQKRALIFVRESNAIDNQTYRQLNASPILTASRDLGALCDVELLERKGSGRATYYVPGLKMLPHILLKNESQLANTPQLDANTPQLGANTPQLDLPADLQKKMRGLGKKPRTDATKKIIIDLCAWKALSADEIASYLGKASKKDLVRTILKPMIEDGSLSYTHPDMSKHPQQKYRVTQFK